MEIAFVGCGFVAPLYFQSLSRHPELKLAGVFDLDSRRSRVFSEQAGCRRYQTFEDLLDDTQVDAIINLTNPGSHYQVLHDSLSAGKHVYSEKPLTLCMDEAHKLVDLSKQRGLQLCTAPTTVLSESAQTMWRALREGKIGKPCLALAEIHDGYFCSKRFRRWKNAFGIPWPYLDEFELGCTLEHVGYFTTWLTSFWGPAVAVTSFGSNVTPDKGPNGKTDSYDFTVAMIEFSNGAVARLTASIVAPADRSMTIIGDQGIISVQDCWKHQSDVRIMRRFNIRNRLIEQKKGRKLRLVHKTPKVPRYGDLRIDFAQGIADMADAIKNDRVPRLNCDFGLHNTEITLVCAGLLSPGQRHVLQTTFDPIPPMPWAQEKVPSHD